jgi:hypothetical protein
MSLLDSFRPPSSRKGQEESSPPEESSETRQPSPPSQTGMSRRRPAQPRPAPTPIPPRPRPDSQTAAPTPSAQPRPAPTPIPSRPRPSPQTAAPPPPVETSASPASATTPPSASERHAAERKSGRGINPGLRLRAIEAAAQEASPKKVPLPKRVLRRPEGKLTMQAYWTVTGTISLIVNAILIAALLIMSRYIYVLSTRLSNELLYTGLYESFGAMDAASIRTQIPINTTVHASIPVTINQTTDVVLTRDTTITQAYVTLSTGGLEIVRAPTNILLPAGTVLPVRLNLTVPVEADIPVAMTVPVNIPLNRTELHEPFVTLRRAVQPYALTFYDPSVVPVDPSRPWLEEPICRSLQGLCNWWFMEVDFPQP